MNSEEMGGIIKSLIYMGLMLMMAAALVLSLIVYL
jgi:hypothetical protein